MSLLSFFFLLFSLFRFSFYYFTCYRLSNTITPRRCALLGFPRLFISSSSIRGSISSQPKFINGTGQIVPEKIVQFCAFACEQNEKKKTFFFFFQSKNISLSAQKRAKIFIRRHISRLEMNLSQRKEQNIHRLIFNLKFQTRAKELQRVNIATLSRPGCCSSHQLLFVSPSLASRFSIFS